ncbi:unnamed protein product, partial [Ectocarpus sp. 8 AP-2014]
IEQHGCTWKRQTTTPTHYACGYDAFRPPSPPRHWLVAHSCRGCMDVVAHFYRSKTGRKYQHSREGCDDPRVQHISHTCQHSSPSATLNLIVGYSYKKHRRGSDRVFFQK